MNLRFDFRSGGVTLRSLPDFSGTHPRLFELDLCDSEAPGGPTDLRGVISRAEYLAHAAAYVPGNIVRVWDAEDVDGSYPDGRLIWEGRLDNAPREDPDGVVLHANGLAKDPDDRYADRLWQTRDLDDWTAGDAKPHEYDQDPQIDARVGGQRLILGWKRRTPFLRASGKTRLDGARASGATTITVLVNAGGLGKGETIWIGGDKYTTANTYNVGSTSIPLSSALRRDYDDNTDVRWRANNNPSRWRSGLVCWKEGRDLERIKATIKLNHLANAKLDVLTANGPDGALTEQVSVDLSAGSLTKNLDVDLPGTDLVMIALTRYTQSDNNGTDKGLRVSVEDVVVYGLAPTTVYAASDVVKDIAGAYGGDQSGIVASGVDAMPLDGEGVSDGAILDELCLLTNRYWSRRAKSDGSGREWHFGAWGSDKTWTLEASDFPVRRHEVTIRDLPRWNVVKVPYRGPGGTKRWASATAVPDPFPGEEFVLRVNLDDPLPNEAQAEVFAAVAVDRVAEIARSEVVVTFTQIKNSSGAEVPGTRVRVGDTITLADYDDLTLRVARLSVDGETVTASNVPVVAGDTGDPVLDRVLARRTLHLARGRPNAAATIGGFDLDRPAVPTNVTLAFKEVDRRGGHRRFDAILNFDPVTEDVNGAGTAIKEYVGFFKFTNPDGSPATEVNDGKPLRVSTKKRRDDDPDPDDLSTRIVLRNVPKPHKLKCAGAVLAEDWWGERSRLSDYTASAKPAAFAPPAPSGLTLSANNRQLEAEWDRDDDVETESDGTTPMLDRRVAYFSVERFKNNVKRGKTIKVKGSSKTWRLGDGAVGATMRVEVTAVDHYGNRSATTTASIVIANDTTHRHAAGTHSHTGGSHSHSHAVTHQHGHSGTHTHPANQHHHSHNHSHGNNHRHEAVRHTGHGHGFTDHSGHAHGGATTGFSANPGGVGSHNHVIASGGEHGHSFVSGGSHIHGFYEATSGGSDTSDSWGRPVGATTALRADDLTSGPDTVSTLDDATGHQGAPAGSTDPIAPGTTDPASSGTTTSGTGDTDTNVDL